MTRPAIALMAAVVVACSGPRPDSESSGRPTVIAKGEGEHLMLMGYRPLYITVDPVTVGSTTLVSGLSDIAPGDSIPIHKHLNEDEILFVHRGTAEITLGETVQRAGPGATVFIPRGTWIGVRAVADTVTTLFVFNTPAFEKCLRGQSSRPGQPFTRPSPSALEGMRRECHQVRKAG